MLKFHRVTAALAAAFAVTQVASIAAAEERKSPPPDESVLGELVVHADAEEHVTPLAILPSLSPDLEDVTVRAVVRRDFELTGMFKVIPDSKAPAGLYGFEDPVDVQAWRNIGAEVIIKVAAKRVKGDQVKVFGLAYFVTHGKEPVYRKTLVVPKDDVRVTAHRITDALLGAITGRNGGFASHMTFSGDWSSSHVVFTMDADGHNLKRVSDSKEFSVAPTWGPDASLFYSVSREYRPFEFIKDGDPKFSVPFKTSVYSADFSDDGKRLAVAVADSGKSAIWVGNADGTGMKKVSTSELATHPVFSPSGKLAWMGGNRKDRMLRIYMDGKAISPAGFTASSPTFCNTEDGVFLIYSVSVGNDNQDLILSPERGGSLSRLTQHQGSNTYPACSPDGRMLAFFSTRKNAPGLYVMSLKRWTTQRISGRVGQSLRWAALPPPTQSMESDTKNK